MKKMQASITTAAAFVVVVVFVVVEFSDVVSGVPHAAGHSNSFRKQDDYGNYAFAYNIHNGHGAVNGRKESGSHGGVVGSYYIGDIDGRHRSVHYVADKLGFRAQIKTNEPGTKSSHPAAAIYDSANGRATHSGSLHVAAHVPAQVVKAAVPHAYTAPYGAYGAAYGGYGGHGGYSAQGSYVPIDHYYG